MENSTEYPINNAHVTIVWEVDGKVRTLTAPKVNATVKHETDYETVYSDYGYSDARMFPRSSSLVINMDVRQDKNGKFCKIKEKRIPRITLDSLTPASIALGATELGLGDDTAFDVEKDQDKYIVTFTEKHREELYD